MAIADTDIKFMLSVKTGSAGNSLTSTPAASLGKYVSTTQMGTGAGVLFDNVTGTENAAMESEYRCVFIKNDHATLTALVVTVYITNIADGADVTIALDDIATSAKGSSSAQAAQITDEDTPPSGVGSFSAPTTDGAGLSVGSLAPGEVKAIWVKRTTTDSGPVAGDGFTLRYSFDTDA